MSRQPHRSTRKTAIWKQLWLYGKLFVGAAIVLVGCFGLFINLHDWIFLLPNIAFVAVGLYLLFGSETIAGDLR